MQSARRTPVPSLFYSRRHRCESRHALANFCEAVSASKFFD
jgi:hypothetical protein